MSFWKEMANKRREERQAKNPEEVPKHRPKKKKKPEKPYIVELMPTGDVPSFLGNPGEWRKWSRFAEKSDATHELKKLKRGMWGDHYKFRIREEK